MSRRTGPAAQRGHVAGGGARGQVGARGPGGRPWSVGQGAGPAAPSSSRDAAPSLGSQAPTMARAGLDRLSLCWAGPQRGGPRPRERLPTCATQVLSECPSPTQGALIRRRGCACTSNPAAPPAPLHTSRRRLPQRAPRVSRPWRCVHQAHLAPPVAGLSRLWPQRGPVRLSAVARVLPSC